MIGVEDDPFAIYRMPKGSKPDRRKLTLDEIQSLQSLDLEPESRLRIARDLFVTAFYLGGMRFSDVVRLKPEQVRNGRVTYRMLKTDQPISNPIPNPLTPILSSYVDAGGTYLFPLLADGDERDPVHLRRRIGSKNAIVNLALKEVAKLAGIEPEGLTMHVARHSWADFARRRNGNLFAISKTLGHRDLATTQAYLSSLDQQAVDQLAEDLWR